MNKKAVLFFSTFETKRQAEQFASACLDQGLAACINILPSIKSVYIWKKKKCVSKEVLIIGKTTRTRFETLKKNLKALHPYEVPELIAFDIQSGYAPYVQWIFDSVR